MRLGLYILRLLKLSSNSLRSTLYFTKINLKYVTFLNHSFFDLFHKNLIFPVGCAAFIKLHISMPYSRVIKSSPPLSFSPSPPRT